VRRLSLALVGAVVGAALAGCAGLPDSAHTPAGVAVIGRGASLVLPTPPGYPDRKSLTQAVIADARGRRMAFDAVLDLSPETVEVAIAAPSGPRLAGITWTAKGVTPLDATAAPKGLRSENLLADIFMTLWPRAAVEAALRPAGEVRDLPDGAGRIVLVGGVPRVEIRTVKDADGGTRTTVRNLDFGYTLTLIGPPGA
jgi:hypothetical protein